MIWYNPGMAKVIAAAGMSISLDGFINDRNGDVGILNSDYAEASISPSFQEMITDTGAVIMGRHVYDGMADPFMWANDDYGFQTPIFVLTHNPPEKYPEGNSRLSFTFVTEGIVRAVSLAVEAAGDKNIQVLGANTIQQCLNAGLCDELQLNTVSILVGEGLRLLKNIDADKIQLERTKVEEITSIRTGVTFKVTKTGQ